ncbi:enoyl-CoA hydratase/isomerase family protein [Zavarzinia compransoris]|nr:enoyl-CoA hydratase/isomerase family protein [Zavarzinia compransoris]TDP44018.1 enoyl-CoA hydratase/carnithine racemase [Zavarzinia compransoris]
MRDSYMKLAFEGAVATLTLSRAPVNAVDDDFLADLDQALSAVEVRDDLAVLRIRSDQRVFCAGADLRLVAGRLQDAAGAAAMVTTVRRFHAVYDHLASLPVVTVAEITGHALGGGLELALACDLRVVSDRAKLGLPEAKVGLLPGAGGTQRLTELCGPGVAARVILTGDLIPGEEAERIGLAQWVFPQADFEAGADAIAARIAGLSPEALRASKNCVRIAATISQAGVAAEISGIGRLMRSKDTERRVHAFLGA